MERPAWKRRADEFERERRRPLKWIAIFAALYLLFFVALTVVAALWLDMDGHSAIEEPVRAFLYRSIRALVGTVYPILHLDRFSPPIAGILAIVTFLGSAALFGIVATLLTRRFRNPRRSG